MIREPKPTLSKTDTRYWYDRLFKRSGDDYHVQIAFAGHQERFPLRTANKDAAAAKAKEIYLSLHAKGWDQTREIFKPWTNQVQKIESPTVGEFLNAVESHAGIDPVTFTSYARKFRRLVSAIKQIKGDASRFHHGDGCQKWRARVDAVKLSEIAPAAVSAWRDRFVESHRGNALKQHHAKTTAHSILRNAKSLFSKKVMKKLREANVEIKWPSPLPLDGVEIGKPPSHKYQSTIDAKQLAADANKELRKNDVEAFKVFMLAFAVGLRRGELDRLTWAQFNWITNQINVTITEHGDNKSEHSNAAVDVDPAVMKIFKRFKESATGEFVIESKVKPQPAAKWHHYRCAKTFRRLNSWLRSKGVNVQKPTHTLRKEFGSLICEQFGIFAASEALRHSDIRITQAHYVERRGRIHLEVGKMLK